MFGALWCLGLLGSVGRVVIAITTTLVLSGLQVPRLREYIREVCVGCRMLVAYFLGTWDVLEDKVCSTLIVPYRRLIVPL